MIDRALQFSMKYHLSISIIHIKGLEIIKKRIRVLKIQGKKIMVWDINKNQIRTYKKVNILSAIYGYSNSEI